MNFLKNILVTSLLLLLLSSCIFTGNGLEPEDIAGCYLTSIPDPHSPDANPPLTDFYIQLWADGTGEGGFWETTLMESDFFTWEIENDTLVFTSDFYLFDNTVYYVSVDPIDGRFNISAEQGGTLLATFSPTSDTVSTVNYTNDQITGTWTSGSTSYVFGADGSLNITGYSPTTWTKGDIPYTLEIGWGSEWAVRMYNGKLAIMAGYMNILYKQ